MKKLVGKTYVCADIHGLWERYIQVYDHVGPDDTLYILGDVIDRGADGIKIIKDIMKRKNVELLIGNHEHMLLQALYKKNSAIFDLWCSVGNGGGITYTMLINEPLWMQYSILCYLIRRPLCVSVQIEDTLYVLTHSGPVKLGIGNQLKYYEANDQLRDMITWYSPYRNDTYIPFEAYDLQYHYIIGHVPVQKREKDTILTCDNITDIDCGCAMAHLREDTSLTLLCLNDFTVQYLK